MIRLIFTTLLFFSLSALHCSQTQEAKKNFRTGSDILLANGKNLISGKRVSLVINHTSILSNGTHLLDTLSKIKDINIHSVFSPEHGLKGNYGAGEKINDSTNNKSSTRFYSLYGKTLKPTREMLNQTEIILIDLQDVGARFYTYISSLYNILEAAAENNIPVLILDRPNPYSGIVIGGPIIEKSMQSFIGIAPIPILHGMTIGELSLLFSREYLFGKNLQSELKVIKMEGWHREFYLDDLTIKWINPSPNINSFETILLYPATCLLEGTNISEGRGTENPFLQIGSPFIDPQELIDELKLNYKVEGIRIRPVKFIPEEISGVASSPKYEGVVCKGISIEITDRKKFDSVKFGIQLISALVKLYENEFKFNADHFDKLIGNKNIRKMILSHMTIDSIVQSWSNELDNFKQIRKKYLLY